MTNLIRDQDRLIRYFKSAIEASPLQAYASVLAFSPSSSITRYVFKDDAPKWLLGNPEVDTDWSPCTLTLEGHTSEVNSISFAHDNAYLASAGKDGTIRLWDPMTGACLLTMKFGTARIESISSAHRCNLLAAAVGKEIKILDPASASCVQTLLGHTGLILSLAFSYDDKFIVSSSLDMTIMIWDRQKGERLHMLDGSTGPSTFVEFSHSDDCIISCDGDRTIRMWDRRTGECLRVMHDKSQWLGGAQFSPSDGFVAAGSEDGVQLWNTTTGACDRTLVSDGYRTTCLDFSREGYLLASGSLDYTIKLWDWKSGKYILALRGHTARLTCVAFSKKGNLLASGSYDRTVRVWDSSVLVDDLEEVSFYDGLVASSHDGRWLAASARRATVQLWDAQSGKCIWTGKGHTAPISFVSFSHNNRFLASGSYDMSIRIWDVAAGKCLHVLWGHTKAVLDVVFSYDDLLAVSVSNNETIIWGLESETLLFELSKGWKVVAFSRGSRLLALGSDWSFRSESILFLQVRPGTQRMELIGGAELRGHDSLVNFLTFSHSDRWLASGSEDSTIKIWDPETRKCVYTLSGHRKPSLSVAWAPDDRWLVSASSDETMQFWDISNGTHRRTRDIYTPLRRLQVDRSGSEIHTEIGTFHIDDPLITDLHPVQRHREDTLITSGYGISPDRAWITWNGQNVLWLPPERRSENSVVMGSTVAIGSNSRRLLLLRFSADGPSP